MHSPTTSKKVFGCIVWAAIVFSAAAIGATASINAGSFYAELIRPSWAAPSWVFGPAWTVLYVLMSIAAWLIWSIGGFRAAKSALMIFLAQLVFNASWSWLFFAWHRGALAFADILVLLILIIATLGAFWRIKRLAGLLLVPYFLWVCFAAVLNYSVWQLNPQILG